jgi:hypothetical protein
MDCDMTRRLAGPVEFKWMTGMKAAGFLLPSV